MRFAHARLLAFLLPAALLAGAYSFQYFAGLYPCEMCWWQRYPLFAAVPVALLSFLPSNPGVQRALVALAGLAILTSGLIGGFHAGVEYGLWEGLTSCTKTISGSGDDLLKSILAAPLIRCDKAPWTLLGISLAGFNFLLSSSGAIMILWSIWKSEKA